MKRAFQRSCRHHLLLFEIDRSPIQIVDNAVNVSSNKPNLRELCAFHFHKGGVR